MTKPFSRFAILLALVVGVWLPRPVIDSTWVRLGLPALFVSPMQAAISKPSIYLLSFSAGVLAAPADSTTYYFGNSGTVSPSTTEGLPSAIRVLHNGRAISVGFEFFVAGTLATTESVTTNLRLNATTDTLLNNNMAHNVSGNTQLWNTFTPIAIVKNQTLQFKLVTPAWATNPTNVSYMGTILLEADSR